MVEVWSKSRNLFLRSIVVTLFGVIATACGGRNSSNVAQLTIQDAISEDKLAAYPCVIFSDSMTAERGDTIDLGTMGSGEVIEKIFTIRNTTSTPLVINDISTDCGCTTVEYSKKPLGTNKSVIVKLRYNSGGQSGWQFKALRVVTSQGGDPRKIYLTAEVE